MVPPGMGEILEFISAHKSNLARIRSNKPEILTTEFKLEVFYL